MDKRIFITLIGIILLIGVFIGIKALLRDQCEVPEFSFTPSVPSPGDVVTFNCENSDEQLTWNFGDGKTSSGKSAVHSFDSAGKYMVTVSGKEDCSSSQQVVVRVPRKMERVDLEVRYSPSVIHVSDPVIFTEMNKEAENWKWKVTGNGANDSATGNPFRYSFRRTGSYKVTAAMTGDYVNGDTSFMVLVKPAVVVHESPPPTRIPKNDPAPERPKPDPKPEPILPSCFSAPSFTEDQLLTIGNDLCGDENASNKWRDVIMPKLAFGSSTSVELHNEKGESIFIKVEEFKRKLTLCNIKITGITLSKDKNKCVTKIKANIQTLVSK